MLWSLLWPSWRRSITKDRYVKILWRFMNQSTDAKYQVLTMYGLKYIYKYKRQKNFFITSSILRTRSDSKVTRLVPKKSFISFIHQRKYGHLQSTCLVPAHTFSSSDATVYSISGTQLEECHLRFVLQTSGRVLLLQNGVLSLPILLFQIRSRRAWDQVRREAAASP